MSRNLEANLRDARAELSRASERIQALQRALRNCLEWVEKSETLDDARGHVRHLVEAVKP